MINIKILHPLLRKYQIFIVYLTETQYQVVDMVAVRNATILATIYRYIAIFITAIQYNTIRLNGNINAP